MRCLVDILTHKVAEIRSASCLQAWVFRSVGFCSERFWLVLSNITWLLRLVAGKYFTPRWACTHRLQCSRLRVMSYIHPSWPPTERSSLFHSAFALLNSKEVFYLFIFLPGKQRKVQFTDFIDFPIFKHIAGSIFKCGTKTYSTFLLVCTVKAPGWSHRLPTAICLRMIGDIRKWGGKWNTSRQGWREKRENGVKRW